MNKRIIFLFLIISSFFAISIKDVFAANFGTLNSDYTYQLDSFNFLDCDNTSCTTQTNKAFNQVSSGNKVLAYTSQTNWTFGTNYGAYWQFRSNFHFVSGYAYTVSILYGNSGGSYLYEPTNVKTSVSSSDTRINADIIASTAAQLGSCTINGWEHTRCGRLTITFVPNADGMWLYFRTKPIDTFKIGIETFSISPNIGVLSLGRYDNHTSDDVYYQINSAFSDLNDTLSSNQNAIIKNQNSNQQNIINNNNSNANSIMSNQNSNTQNQISNENKNHDEMMNGDAESSFKGDGGSVSNYNKAESDLMNKIDVNTDSINLDMNTYAKPFSWIWLQVDRLINLNPKIFGLIITILTFGFIGLVIGR